MVTSMLVAACAAELGMYMTSPALRMPSCNTARDRSGWVVKSGLKTSKVYLHQVRVRVCRVRVRVKCRLWFGVRHTGKD